MKKILLFLLCSSFFCAKCGKETIKGTIEGGPFAYKEKIKIHLSDIKDTRLKSIKVTFENLYGIQPHFNISGKKGRFVAEKKRGEYSLYDENGRIYYFNFKDIRIFLTPPDDEELEFSLGKKRIYEMKLYLNDKLFFTKKISFTPERYKEGPLLESIRSAHKTEVDDMKYVVSIRRFGGFPGYDCFIKITDEDVKKWLDGKP